ncbi:glyoxylate/hydroxypyruvate reductase HPR3 [Tanacetum coccineum]
MADKNNNNNLPIAIIHRVPTFQFDLTCVSGICTPVEPSDPSYHTHQPSARVILAIGPIPLTSAQMGQYPSLECVIGTSAGVNRIDLDECRRRGVRVTNAGDAFSEDGADYAVGLLLDVLRLLSASDRYVRTGLWPANGFYPLGNSGGKRVGIVGHGKYRTLDANGLSTHIINRDVLKALGNTGVLVNIGRGGLVDENELVKFLVGREIRGAGLDVFENEPEVPKELYTLDNVVLSPHKAILTPESFAGVREVVTQNLKAFFSNEPLLSEVNLHDS